MSLRVAVQTLLLTAAIAIPARADSPRLASFMPVDVGLYLEAQRPADLTARMAGSEIANRLRAFPPFRRWINERHAGFGAAITKSSADWQVDIRELAPRLFAEGIALGVWPPANDDIPPRLLLIVHARDEEAMRQSIDTLARVVASQSGVQLDERQHIEDKYWIARAANGETLVWFQNAEKGVLSNDEGLVLRCMELMTARKRPARPVQVVSLASHETEYEAAHLALDPGANVRCWLNPRAWDAAFSRELAKDEALLPEDRELALSFWRQTRYLAATASVERGVSFELAVAYNVSRLPESGQVFHRALAGVTRMMDRLPSEGFASYAGHFDFIAVSKWLGVFPSALRTEEFTELREMLLLVFAGWDPLEEALEGVGPDVAAFVAPSTQAAEGEAPFMAAFAIQGNPQQPHRPAPAAVIEQALRGIAAMLVTKLNTEAGMPLARIHEEVVDGTRLTWISGVPDWPPGVEFAVASAGEALWIGTCPHALRATLAQGTPGSLLANDRFRSALGSRFDQPGQVLFINARAIRRWLEKGDRVLVAWVLRQRDTDEATAWRGVEQLRSLSQLFDDIVVAAKFDDGGARFRLAVRAD